MNYTKLLYRKEKKHVYESNFNKLIRTIILINAFSVARKIMSQSIKPVAESINFASPADIKIKSLFWFSAQHFCASGKQIKSYTDWNK